MLIMEAMKKPTIADHKIFAGLELVCLALNYILALIMQALRILYWTENLYHKIEIIICNPCGDPATSENYAAAILRIIYKGIVECGAVGRGHGW